MDLYLVGPASDPLVKRGIGRHHTPFLLSYFKRASDDVLRFYFDNCRLTLCDSGAYSFMVGAAQPDWREYVEGYADFLARNPFDYYFELDIDGLIGYDNVKRIRRYLQQVTGRQPIPVWHKRLGTTEFKAMCAEYPYVAIGGIVSKEILPAEYPKMRSLISYAHSHGCRIHGLGFTRTRELTAYHFDSVDSSSWNSGTRFGVVYTYRDGRLVKSRAPDGHRVVPGSPLYSRNYEAWAEFSDYARVRL